MAEFVTTATPYRNSSPHRSECLPWQSPLVGEPELMDIRRQIADQVFILRFWQELHSDQGQRWRAQVRDVNTGQLHVFDDVEAAFAIVRSSLPSIETNHLDTTTGNSK